MHTFFEDHIFTFSIMIFFVFQLKKLCSQGSALTWRRTGDKPLSEPMLTWRICALLGLQNLKKKCDINGYVWLHSFNTLSAVLIYRTFTCKRHF